MLINTLKSALIVLFTANLHAAEVDNFTKRDPTLPDSTKNLNEYGNKLFNKIVEKTNREKSGCDEEKLYKNLRKEFRNGYIGDFIKHLKESDTITRYRVPFKQSIYSQFSAKDAIVTGLLSKRVFDTTASVININGHLVGTDKFEHFSGTGFRYFKSYYLEKKSLDETVEIGFSDEYGILGAWSTGIISYGDLAAEFNGMRFWNHILQRREDILNENIGPYLECTKGKWLAVKPIDWSFYVDDSWDEAINCSEFRNWTMVAKVKYKLKELSTKTGKTINCPINQEKVQPLLDKYHQFGQYILNFRGINLSTK